MFNELFTNLIKLSNSIYDNLNIYFIDEKEKRTFIFSEDFNTTLHYLFNQIRDNRIVVSYSYEFDSISKKLDFNVVIF